MWGTSVVYQAALAKTHSRERRRPAITQTHGDRFILQAGCSFHRYIARHIVALNLEKLNSLRLKKKFSREIEPGGMVLCERYQLVARFTPLKSKARVQRVKVIK